MVKLAHRAVMPDLAPRKESEIEWWFVQGQLRGQSIGTCAVMAAFFCIRGPEEHHRPGEMLIQHVVFEETGESWCDSRVTPETVRHHETIARRVITGCMPRALHGLALRKHLGDITMSARANGVVTDGEGLCLDSDPFRVAWNGFSLEKRDNSLLLKATIGPGRTAHLTLDPKSHWLDERSEQLESGYGSAFAYQCCPRLQAQGTVDGAPVEGLFWVDRQWGRYQDWLLAPAGDGYRVLGWDWFGLNLDDGRDVIVNRHRDAATAQEHRVFGIVFTDGVPARARRVAVRPTRLWTSPRNGARYPVAWSLELPELGIAGTVEPVVDDQEIPIYGTEAIWEGAVRFRGRDANGTVTGTGRLELSGYGAALTSREHFRRDLYRFGNRINAKVNRRLGGRFSRSG
jgi:predicted secreted hydrolase